MSILDDYMPNSFPNRTLCDVLRDMRNCVKVLNFSMIPGLIEEAQVMGNKMEAALQDNKDIKDIRDQIKKGKQELKQLKNELRLTTKIKELK